MRRRLAILAVVLLVVMGAVLAVSLLRRPPVTDRIFASGTIEADEVEISPKVQGRLARLYVDEGDRVQAGQVVAQLDTRELGAQVAQAQGAYDTALARLNDLRAGSRPEQIRQAQANLAQAQSGLAGARQALATAREAYTKSTALAGQVRQAEAGQQAAQAALAQARARLALVQEGTRPEQIAQAQANLAAAQAALDNAQGNLRRAEQLSGSGAISAQQLDAARQARDSAQAALEAAQARLQEAQAGPRAQEREQAAQAVRQAQATLEAANAALATAREAYADRLDARARREIAQTQYQVAQDQVQAARAQLDLLLAGATPQAIAAARGQVQQAAGALAFARQQLANATVRSPLTGVVLTKVTEPGELVTPGQPIVTAASLNPLTLRVYVTEPEKGLVKLGQRAWVSVDSYPGERFPARVVEIAQQAEFTPRNIQTQQERVKLVFGVKLAVANPEGKLNPGMPADAVILLDRGG